MKPVSLAALMLATIVLAGCEDRQSYTPTYSPPVDTRMSTGELSKRLKVSMPESEVVALRDPDRVGMQTCGQNTGRPWNCRVLHYGFSFMVILQEVNGAWLVNGWT